MTWLALLIFAAAAAMAITSIIVTVQQYGGMALALQPSRVTAHQYVGRRGIASRSALGTPRRALARGRRALARGRRALGASRAMADLESALLMPAMVRRAVPAGRM